MPSSHRATITIAAVLGAVLFVVAILATTGLIVWEPSVSVDVLLYNVSSVLMIAALACHIGCRIYHRSGVVEARQERLEQRQQQMLTELRQINAIMQAVVAQAGSSDVDRLAAALGKRLDDLANDQWSEGFAAGAIKRTNVAPLPRTPIGRG